MELKDGNILLAGASGFLGAAVAKRLSEEGCSVTALSRQSQLFEHKGLRWRVCDLAKRETLCQVAQSWPLWDAVVYLAANIPKSGQKKENLREARESSLDPFLNLLEALAGRYRHLIYASSIDVYGVPSKGDYSESEALNPLTPYALAKLAGEYYAAVDSKNAKGQLTILRFSQIYGPNEPLVRVISVLREALSLRKTFRLMTSGRERRRFVYLTDAAEAVLCALRSNNVGTFNIAGKDVLSIMELINLFTLVSGRNLNLEYVSPVNPAFDNVPDITAAERALNFYPAVTMKQGLEQIWSSVQ